MPRYMAHFTPEAWIRDYAVAIDFDGENEWDCTSFVNAQLADEDGRERSYMEQLVATVRDDGSAIDDWDRLRGDPEAPDVVREHQGPFTIEVRIVQ
jgi:hypothetical protein